MAVVADVTPDLGVYSGEDKVLLFDIGQSTTGWTAEWILSDEANSPDAAPILSISGAAVLVSQAVTSGATNGIAVTITASQLAISPTNVRERPMRKPYRHMLRRTNSSNKEVLSTGDFHLLATTMKDGA